MEDFRVEEFRIFSHHFITKKSSEFKVQSSEFRVQSSTAKVLLNF
jgi:hypothetical protein